MENIILTDPLENTDRECDQVLGGYMRVWDQMHIMVIEALAALLGTHSRAAYILVTSGIDQPTLRTILESAGRLRLGKTGQKKLEALLRRWKDASSKRNRIVHGVWQLSLVITEQRNDQGIKRTKGRWVRYYPPADMNKIDPALMKKNQKLRAAHYFELHQIAEATQNVRQIARDFDAFLKDADIKPFVDALPVKFDQYGAYTPQSAAAEPPHSTHPTIHTNATPPSQPPEE